MLGLRFQNHHVADGIQRLVLDGGQPAGLGIVFFELGDFVHDLLPSPLGGGGVARLPVHTSQLQAECWCVLGFVFSGDEPVGFGLVAGLETALLFGDEVFAVIRAPPTAEHPITIFHFTIHVVSMNRPCPPALASSGRVKPV